MNKILAVLSLMLAFSTTVFADVFNPYDNLYKNQVHKEMKKGVAQYNYMVVDENGAVLPNVTLKYVNHDNRVMSAIADANGKVHVEFRQPTFIQLLSMIAVGEEYRIIGDDLSDDIDLKDIQKGDVKYRVIQRHAANTAAYVYDAD